MAVWKILGVDVLPAVDGHENVVVAVHFSVEVEGSGRKAKLFNVIDMSVKNDADYVFKPLAELTESDLLDFVMKTFEGNARQLENTMQLGVDHFNKTYIAIENF